MNKRISTAPFRGTAEQKNQLIGYMESVQSKEGALILILQKAQEIYGYLPEEVQIMIAKKLGITLSEVYGVSTFYSQFSLTPKGQYNISVCLGTACYVKNSSKILDKISSLLGIKPEECTADGKFSLTACRCLGACGLAPVMKINDEVYGRVTESDVEKILDKYR